MANKMRSNNPPEKKNTTTVAPTVISRGPPDGGWGWCVVFGSFMIHVVTDGVTYSFGVLYNEFLNVFQGSKGATAWIASLLVGVTLCSGPIASIFVNKYGCRAVTIVGAILASVCMMASVLANNLITLYITIGFGTGLGFGMIYLPAIVSVTCYFEKYRSLATGIAVCGSGLGTFIFAPFVEFLVSNYGWKPTVAVISGLVFLCTLFGLLFRPLPTDEQLQQQQQHQQLATGESVTPVVLTIVEPPAECQPLNGNVVQGSQSFDQIPNSDDDGGTGDEWRRLGSGKLQKNMLLPIEVSTNTFGNDLDKQSRFTLSQPELIVPGFNSRLNTARNEVCYASQNLKPHIGNGGIMYQKDIFYSGSLKNVNINRRRTISQTTNVNINTENASSTDLDKFSDRICCSGEAQDTIKQMLDFTLLKDPIFILYTVSNFLTSIGFNIPYLYLLPQAEIMGIPSKHSSYLLALLGIANTVGRVVLGFISDKPWINRLLVYNVCLTVCGIATILSTYCTDLLTFSLYTIVFGSTIGAYVGLTSVILVDLLGIDKLTNAFGILLMFQGFASLAGPPIAGWLYDVLGSYNPAFYLSGSNIALSGVMLFVIPYVQRYYERKELDKMTA
ncbi:Major facilitator superfamily,Major facilitator superfamily domain [Cinara cedri]|uniref:Major facilitator superfamily,Major facilitator superfamily domain n=1 Tax=Cinara cedri TaxID=506608 RepID=A0A5E4M6Z6_9HEMI|nr:Major facilitator superfamily,Major facilitator superfamily domain [Cinara cedri]